MNDSDEMCGVMQYLSACAAHGCAVVILHHPAKTENSTGRGSSTVPGALTGPRKSRSRGSIEAAESRASYSRAKGVGNLERATAADLRQ